MLCGQNALLDLKDIKKIINYITEEGKEEIAKATENFHLDYRNHSRKIIELEQQGAELFLAKCHLT
jgi:hypothetical protein